MQARGVNMPETEEVAAIGEIIKIKVGWDNQEKENIMLVTVAFRGSERSNVKSFHLGKAEVLQ
jgi:hypothetical protein